MLLYLLKNNGITRSKLKALLMALLGPTIPSNKGLYSLSTNSSSANDISFTYSHKTLLYNKTKDITDL